MDHPMTRASITRQFRYRQERTDGDQGFILITFVVLSLIILSLVGVSIQASITNQTVTGRYVNSIQARLASESGINAALASVASSAAPGSLQCSVSYASGSWTYATTIGYASSTGTAMTCPLSTWPVTAHVISTGTSTFGGSVKMAEDTVIAAPATAQTTLLPALNYAVFTPGGMQMSANATIANGLSGQQADVVVGGGTNCTNGNTIGGNLYSYRTSPLKFDSTCTIGKGVFANSAVSLTNNVNIGGSVTSYGSGGITLSASPTIGGNMTSTQGSIDMSNSPTVKGNAYAYTSINYNRKAVGSGAAGSNLYIQGLVSYPNTNFAGQTMPTQPTFPAITDPTQNQWGAAGYSNYIVVTDSAVTTNGLINTTYTCNNYFTAQYLAPSYSGSASAFALAVNNATTPTVIDASACSNPDYSNPGNSQTFSLQTNVALLVNGIGFATTNNFQSSSSATHNLSIIVPSPDTGGINFTNTTTFAPQLSTFIYTPGRFTASVTPSINGQVLAGDMSSSSVSITNNFALTFSNAAAATIPGTTTTSGGSTTTAAIVGVRRYVSP